MSLYFNLATENLNFCIFLSLKLSAKLYFTHHQLAAQRPNLSSPACDWIQNLKTQNKNKQST